MASIRLYCFGVEAQPPPPQFRGKICGGPLLEQNIPRCGVLGRNSLGCCPRCSSVAALHLSTYRWGARPVQPGMPFPSRCRCGKLAVDRKSQSDLIGDDRACVTITDPVFFARTSSYHLPGRGPNIAALEALNEELARGHRWLVTDTTSSRLMRSLRIRAPLIPSSQRLSSDHRRCGHRLCGHC